MPSKKVDKEAILQRCWEVLNRDGYHAASISTLAEASGLGKAGLLHHFGSKEQLMESVLDYACVQFRSYILSVAGEDLPWEQRLEKLLRRQNRLAKLERRGCFFANTALETGRNGVFNRFIEQIFAEWKQAVGGIYAQVMSLEDAQVSAYRLLLEYEGAVLFYKLTDNVDHLENFVKRTIESYQTQQKQTLLT
jgi:TetR/AcrR family transcriptional regulator, transcriptional repressor for nem operon